MVLWDLMDAGKQHTLNLYLDAESEHHPAQERAVLFTMVYQARTVCDTESIEEEIQHLKKTF